MSSAGLASDGLVGHWRSRADADDLQLRGEAQMAEPGLLDALDGRRRLSGGPTGHCQPPPVDRDALVN